MDTWVPSVVAILAFVLIPMMPKLLRLRLRFLRWLHWDWAANLLEDHFQGWVLFGRIVLFVVAMVALAVVLQP
jgi:hypothetical protein